MSFRHIYAHENQVITAYTHNSQIITLTNDEVLSLQSLLILLNTEYWNSVKI